MTLEYIVSTVDGTDNGRFSQDEIDGLVPDQYFNKFRAMETF